MLEISLREVVQMVDSVMKPEHYLHLVDVQSAGSAVTGLPYALAALTLCQSFSLDLLQVTAMVTLAELWLDLGVSHGARALLLLYQCLPIVLGHGGLELRARTNLAVAHCHLSNPSFSGWSSANALAPLRGKMCTPNHLP